MKLFSHANVKAVKAVGKLTAVLLGVFFPKRKFILRGHHHKSTSILHPTLQKVKDKMIIVREYLDFDL